MEPLRRPGPTSSRRRACRMFAAANVAVATPPRASPVFTGPTAQHNTAATTASAPTAALMMFFRMARKSARSVADTGRKSAAPGTTPTGLAEWP
ncbi:hypothetical protein ACIREO_22740 [Streptomyces sp. NPDC102441]|uniref:hypothetical protein n=1 Tax=Streptomyces sp. NPDC102441 TaxID=3366176 RepID=UPI00381C7C97